MYSLNELVLTIDLTGKSAVMLRFFHKEFNDEDNVMPGTFTGSCNGDGVAISNDGVTWYKVQGLTSIDGISSTWQCYEANLDAAIANAGISYNSTFQIKFQHYDNYPIGSDGFGFDNIRVKQ